MTAGQADALTAYLQRAGWAGPARRGAAVHVVVAPGCTTEGEALRFVEQKDVIKSDFVLLSGSLLGNADLRPAMAAHLARRAADRQAIMTLLLHGGTLPPGEPGDCCLTVLDPLNQQLLRLEQGARTGSGGATLGTHIMGERNSVVVRGHAGHGVAMQTGPCGSPVPASTQAAWHAPVASCRPVAACSCLWFVRPWPTARACPASSLHLQVRLGVRLANIYICAPEVLVLLSDNFDYQSLTGDLVPGVLSEQELGSTLFVHELARVRRAGRAAGQAAQLLSIPPLRPCSCSACLLEKPAAAQHASACGRAALHARRISALRQFQTPLSLACPTNYVAAAPCRAMWSALAPRVPTPAWWRMWWAAGLTPGCPTTAATHKTSAGSTAVYTCELGGPARMAAQAAPALPFNLACAVPLGDTLWFC